jgi:hypothetical protein
MILVGPWRALNMNADVEKKFAVEVTYNGISKSLEVNPEERVSALLQRAIAAFGIVQNPHLFGLFRENGSELPDNESVEKAGLKPGELLILRPSAVRGGSVPLRLASNILPETFGTLRACGRGECECVVYWTGPISEMAVDGVIHPIHLRSPFGYELDSEWLTNYWKQLATSKRTVRAQIHTHPSDAFHSTTDDNWPIVSQPGFVSIVIPDFAEGEPSLEEAWVGRLQVDGRWLQIGSAREVFILT